MADVLGDVKALLMLEDDKRDRLLDVIIRNTEAALRVRASLTVSNPVPDELSHIVTEVAVRRFNRIKNEGMKSYSQEGETITYNDDDFAPFADELAAYADEHKTAKTLGSVTLLNGYGGERCGFRP